MSNEQRARHIRVLSEMVSCGPDLLDEEESAAIDAAIAALEQQVPADGEWVPSGADYDRSIHTNPDAKAWADFFVATFPGLADKHDLMLGWFANAMMAMHDHLKLAATPQAPQPVVDDSQPQQGAVAEVVGYIHEVVWPDGTSRGFHKKPPMTMQAVEARNGIPVCHISERIFPVGEITSPTIGQQAVDDAFNAGWRMAAAWADRDDLLADMDSSAYKTERAAALAAHGKGG